MKNNAFDEQEYDFEETSHFYIFLISETLLFHKTNHIDASE